MPIPTPREMTCPHCGAPAVLAHRAVAMFVCEYCQGISRVRDERLDPSGKSAKLAYIPSRFKVRAAGRLRGEPFDVLGRLRYEHEDGVWDEWYLMFNTDGRAAWLQEDEGMYILYERKPGAGGGPDPSAFHVGQMATVGDTRFLVTEKGPARIAGAEGQVGLGVDPGAEVYFVDGVAGGGTAISLEYTGAAAEIGAGPQVLGVDLQVDGE